MEEFDKIYSEIYKNSYEVLEELRKRTEQPTKNICVLLVLATIGVILLMINTTCFVLFISVAFVIMLILLSESNQRFKGKNTYNQEYQKRVIEPLIYFYDKDLKYLSNNGLSIDDYKEIEPINSEIYESNNLIEKTIKNIIIQSAQVNIYSIHYSDKEQERTLEFSGILVKIKFDSTTQKINLIEKINNEEIIEICRKSGLTFDSKTTENAVFLRFKCGNIFEGNIFKFSLDKDTIYNAYCTIEKIFDTATEIAYKILN